MFVPPSVRTLNRAAEGFDITNRGVNKSQISKIESGYDNLTLTTIAKIFTALNAKISINVELEEGEKLELV